MGEPHVVSALVAKRAELLGLVERHERAIEELRRQLAYLDATLLLFKPDASLGAVRPKRPAQRTGYFRRGTLARACLDLLRRTGKPLFTREIALRVLAERGVDAPDRALVRTVTKSVSKALRGLPREAVAREQRGGQAVAWSIPEDGVAAGSRGGGRPGMEEDRRRAPAVERLPEGAMARNGFVQDG